MLFFFLIVYTYTHIYIVLIFSTENIDQSVCVIKFYIPKFYYGNHHERPPFRMTDIACCDFIVRKIVPKNITRQGYYRTPSLLLVSLFKTHLIQHLKLSYCEFKMHSNCIPLFYTNRF